MKEEITLNLHDAEHLENLYRKNKALFTKAFNSIFPQVSENPVAAVWHQRLNYESDEVSWGKPKDLYLVAALGLVAGFIAKIPDLAGLRPDSFYARNLSFVVFPFLVLYFMFKSGVAYKHLMYAFMVIAASAVYINLLPQSDTSNTLVLACIHLPFLLWGVLGYVFTNTDTKRTVEDFLKYNADLLVMAGLILIGGAIITGVTMGLFSLININVQPFYQQYVIVWGLSTLPIVATFLVQTNPQLVNKVSPVIAKVFAPVVLVTLVCYLLAIIYSGKDPYNDREFLVLFNAMLVGVMAIILFSVIESNQNSKVGNLILLALSLVTVIINGIALSAIVFRISEWGITPNRLAVLGANLLILINLILVSYQLVKVLRNKGEIEGVVNCITRYLPVYLVWAIVVIFILPFLFRFQ